MARPTKDQYAAHFEPYMSMVKGNSIGELILNYSVSSTDFINNLPDDKADFRYAEGKWTVKEVIQHIIDMERVFAFRALSIARGVKESLPGVDQDQFALNHRVQYRAFGDLQEEFDCMKSDHNILFRSFDKQALTTEGLVSGYTTTCESWVYISFGHTQYHIQMLKERYGLSF